MDRSIDDRQNRTVTTDPAADVDQLLKDLIRIDSSNPDLVPGAPGEAAIADFTADWLTARGFTCTRLEATAGRPSVLAVASGIGGGRSLMLNGHLDTVSLVSYSGDGLDPVERDGRIFGRGACDMKSGIAAIMSAAAAAARQPRRGDIIVALVADEEYGSAGTEELLRQVTADSAIVVEPSGLDIVTAHRGFVWAEVTIHGIAAHGSRPDLGIDAIAKAGAFLAALAEHGESLLAGDRHPILGTGNIHASTIVGGEELSSYPATCTIRLERRTVPPEDSQGVERELRRMLERIAQTDPQFRFDLSITFERKPFAAAPDSPVKAELHAAVREVTGAEATERGEPFWTDCALLAEAGIDTVLYGVDGGGAHADTEWVTIESLHQVARVLAATITNVTR